MVGEKRAFRSPPLLGRYSFISERGSPWASGSGSGSQVGGSCSARVWVTRTMAANDLKGFWAPANYPEAGSSTGRVAGGHDEAGAPWVASVAPASWDSAWPAWAAEAAAAMGAPHGRSPTEASGRGRTGAGNV